MVSAKKTVVLTGDIGGTKTNLALYAQGKTRPVLQLMETYSSRKAQDLESLVSLFIKDHPAPVSHACFAVAGPVLNRRCRTTNLPWEVSEARLAKRFGWNVQVINDLVATGLGTLFLRSRELYPLNSAKSRKGGAIALVAPGTGLGTCILTFYNGVAVPVSSEGGHVDFAPTEEIQVGLWKALRKRYGHVSVERVASGMGLWNIFGYLTQVENYRIPRWLARDMEKKEPAQAIAEAAIHRKEEMCMRVLNMFVSVLGSVAGNLALTGMATGGVYLGGGIPPKILPALTNGMFMTAFTDKGRFKDILRRISVRVILNDKTSLLGAAGFALNAAEWLRSGVKTLVSNGKPL